MDVQPLQRFRARFGLAMVLALVLASACESRGPEIETLGFLEDYTQLTPGRPGQASLIYIDEQVDFSAYDAILVEPVVAWAKPDGEPAVATQQLAKDLDEDLRRELAHEFELIDRPRAGSLRLRAALASEAGSHLVLEVELLDATSKERVVAAVDRRELEAAESVDQTDAWAVLIRNRLASFRQFDAATRARDADDQGTTKPESPKAP
jgi:hypothetical protein